MSNMGTVKRAKQKRFFEGYVVSDKMEKTIVVKVQRTFKHPLLGKIIRRSKRYKVHDELMHAKDGDFVKIVETRSLSKTKHMRLVEIMRSVRQGA